MSSKSTAGYNSIPVPVGTLVYYGSTKVPPTFLLCDGSSLSRTQYNHLFQVIGTLYGSTSSTTFNLPNLLTTQFIQGGTISGATNPANPATFPQTPTNVATATIPSLATGHFAYQNSWSVGANINGNNQYYNPSATSLAVQLTATNAVKADSSDYNTWGASVNGGTVGYTNSFQTVITPTLTSADIEPPSLTLLPIIKATSDFFPPYTPLPVATTSTFPIIPASQSFYPPNPSEIYLNDPALSGFIF
jgi:microcystin-dependent protein